MHTSLCMHIKNTHLYILILFPSIMATKKTLIERRDFYSQKRKATQDILLWLDENVPKKKILLTLQLKYGFSEQFYNNVVDLMTADEVSNKDTHTKTQEELKVWEDTLDTN